MSNVDHKRSISGDFECFFALRSFRHTSNLCSCDLLLQVSGSKTWSCYRAYHLNAIWGHPMILHASSYGNWDLRCTKSRPWRGQKGSTSSKRSTKSGSQLCEAHICPAFCIRQFYCIGSRSLSQRQGSYRCSSKQSTHHFDPLCTEDALSRYAWGWCIQHLLQTQVRGRSRRQGHFKLTNF